MSACTGITECGPREYCDKHFKDEARFWATYFCENTPKVAEAREDEVFLLELMKVLAEDAEVECVHL